jgi:hypothetical protein
MRVYGLSNWFLFLEEVRESEPVRHLLVVKGVAGLNKSEISVITKGRGLDLLLESIEFILEEVLESFLSDLAHTGDERGVDCV